MLTSLLSIFVFSAAASYIRAEYRGPQWHIYVFKPLTTSLIILIAGLAGVPPLPLYKYAIVAGLIFSLAGDIFLMLPQDRFIAGLVSFLAAHLCYIAAFVWGTGFQVSLALLLLFLVYGGLLLRILWPHLGQMKGPVVVYAGVIMVMGWQAGERWLDLGGLAPLLAAVGAILFMISDSALAINRFVAPFKSAQLLILSTYFTAQWLIAMSI